jgi:hypothetical protein
MTWHPIQLNDNLLKPYEVGTDGKIRNSKRKKTARALSIENAIDRWNNKAQLTRAGNPPLSVDDLVINVKRTSTTQDGLLEQRIMWLFLHKPSRGFGATPERMLCLAGDYKDMWYFLEARSYVSLVHGPSLAVSLYT